ncbi:22871_t:CDS:2 [Cetraspora pellucida]|uniref:22871_t:CDS:1 n=1 Tax=Cetraspora pellucida TaxID=1433469 RepID=A0A9N9ICA0_9GLOM|nr:22871_t:CDS:2 [Cetraspora pellucida]
MAILKFSFFSKQQDAKPWSFPDESHDEIHKYLYNRELGLNTARLPPNWFSIVSHRMPHLFQETQIDLGNHDKIFCSHWISHNEIVVGTKCNKLLILNVETNKRFEIPLVTGSTNNQPPDNNNSNCSGIRSIAVNPSRTLLAIGAGNPTQVMIYELPSFEPVIVFSGHNDLVFSVAWLDDSHVVSGSRDGTVRLWSIESKIISEMPLLPNKFINVHQPLLTRSECGGKVRDLQFNSKTNQIMTLSTAGYVKLWDASYLNSITKIPLIHTNENVCLSMNSKVNLFAVGSQAHISVIDPRTSSIVHEIDSVDEGVRSLNFNDHIITTGGGYGRLSFYDMRAQNYLLFNTSNDESSVTCNYKETGSGWLVRIDMTPLNIENAIYTLSYDESGTMLFTGGGPLQLGLKGSHATIWS